MGQEKGECGFFKDKVMDKGDEYGMLPQTVGLSMLNQLKEMNLNYKTSKDDPQLNLTFKATIAEIFRDTVITTNLKYKLNHNKRSTQRVFVRQTIDNPPFKPEESLTLNSVRDQQFEDEDLGIVNYEVIPNEIKLFSDLLKRRSNSTSAPKTSKIISLFDSLNNKALSVIRDSIVQTPDGSTPVGFNYGFKEDQAIMFEDLLYVNPDADPNNDSTWEYTFREDDAVLGKSATENPRVHFLDPAIHGGRYRFPKFTSNLQHMMGGWELFKLSFLKSKPVKIKTMVS